jgi:ArsR family transcriptional regulator
MAGRRYPDEVQELKRNKSEESVFELQAEVCKVLASPTRLEIINALKSGPKTIAELAELLGISATSISQHLSVMKARGIVHTWKEGKTTRYAIAHMKIVEACCLMKEVLSDLLAERSRMAMFARKAD